MKNLVIPNLVLWALLLAFQNNALAGIVSEKKRLIFIEGDNKKTLMIANSNDYPILMQTWIDNGDISNTPSLTVSPFIVTPPMSNLIKGEIKALRIMQNKHQNLPSDRESAFWLNLYEVPPVSNEYKMIDNVTVAMNTQIKLFYRPKNLANKPDEKVLASQLTCNGKTNNKTITINCYNPTAYFVSLSNISLTLNNQQYQNEIQLDMMVPPFSSNSYNIVTDLSKIPNQAKVQYSLINDNGDVQGLDSTLNITP